MPRRVGYGRGRGALSGALAGFSSGMGDLIQDRRLRRRSQQAAIFQDLLLRNRQREADRLSRRNDLSKGLITREQFDAMEGGGNDLDAVEPSVETQLTKFLGEPKSAPDIKSVEEFNLGKPKRVGVLKAPSPLAEPTEQEYLDFPQDDPHAQRAANVLRSQRTKFSQAMPIDKIGADIQGEGEHAQPVDIYGRKGDPFGGPPTETGRMPSGGTAGAQGRFAGDKGLLERLGNELSPIRMAEEQAQKVREYRALTPENVRRAGQETAAREEAQAQNQIRHSGMTAMQQTAALQLLDKFNQESRFYNVIEQQAANLAPYAQKIGANRTSDPALNPAEQIGLIYTYMKMLSPESTVMVGEYAKAENTVSVPIWVQNLYNKAIDGTTISAQQERWFTDAGLGIYRSNVGEHQRRIEDYTGRANAVKVPPEFVIKQSTPGLSGTTTDPLLNILRQRGQPAGPQPPAR